MNDTAHEKAALLLRIKEATDKGDEGILVFWGAKVARAPGYLVEHNGQPMLRIDSMGLDTIEKELMYIPASSDGTLLVKGIGSNYCGIWRFNEYEE